MDIYTATEMAYKHGYEKGYEAGKKDAVVHGKWVLPKERYDIVCSVCGGSCWYYDYDQTIGESNYCPNCGAKMDLED